jgi:tetratricopeptide (TPR) repeat protein
MCSCLFVVLVAYGTAALALQGSGSTSTAAARGQVSFTPKRAPVVRSNVDAKGVTADAAIARGAAAFTDEKFDVAVREYERAVALAPASAEAHYWLGLSHYNLGNAAAAVASLQRAVDLDPARVDTYTDLGLAYTDLQDFAGAKRAFRTGLVIDAKVAGLWAGLGVAQALSGELPTARASFDKAMALAPEDCDIRMAAATVAAEERDFESAIASAMKCQDSLKDDPSYWFALSKWYGALRKEDEAIICLEKTVRLKPTYVGYVYLGDVLSRAGRAEEALDAYQEAVRIDPKLPEAVSKVGMQYSYLGDYDQALFAMERAVELDPTSLDAKTALANCYVNSERPSDAMATIAPVLEARPASPHALACAGEASAYVGALDAAAGYYERALRADAKYDEARIWLAICLAGLGRQDDAAGELGQVGQTPPAMAAFYERDLPGKKRPALYLAVVAVLRGGAGDYVGVRRALDAMRTHNAALSDRMERLLKSVGRLRG